MNPYYARLFGQGFFGRAWPIVSDLWANSGSEKSLSNPEDVIGARLGQLGSDLELSLSGDSPNDPPRAKVPGSGVEAYNSVLAPSTLDYLNADLAKHYGMSRETAYQEALSNTAYQRSVEDMQAAGLNPAVLFGSGRGSGADGVGMVRSASSGGSGGYRRRGSSSAKSEMDNEHLFSSGMYGVLSAVGGILGIAATKRPDGYWIGSSIAQGAMQLMNSASKK